MTDPKVTIHRDSPLWGIAAERQRQDAKWGEQNHPDGTGLFSWQTEQAAYDRKACQAAAQYGKTTWWNVMREEVSEAFAESDSAKLRAELVQVAAVAVAWIEAIDRRSPSTESETPA